MTMPKQLGTMDWRSARRAKHPHKFPTRLSISVRQNIPLYRNSDLSYLRDTLTRDKGRIAIVTNRGLGSDGRDGVGRGEPCRAGNREHRLSRLRHGADSVFAWLRVRAHASSRSYMRGRARTNKSCGPDARGLCVKSCGDVAV